MDGLREKVLELASQDGEFAERLSAAETPEAAAELLREKGLGITAEDLRTLAQSGASDTAKLSDDELDAVAGGGVCVCILGGGGKKEGDDDLCYCAWGGEGDDISGVLRCACMGTGGGKTVN